MSNNISYTNLTPNIHLIVNKTDQFKVEYKVSFTAGGAYFEQDGERGVTHLLEHCAVARTKDMDFSNFRNFLFENDIYVNASTSRLFMNFIVSGHKSDQEKMLDLILEFSMNPTLTPKILEQEKEIVLREIERRYGDPNYRLNQFVLNNIFEQGSYYLHETLGEPEEVKATNVEMIESIRKRLLKQSHIIIRAIGNIDVEKIKATVLKSTQNILKASSEDILPIDYQPKNELKKFSYLPLVNELAHAHAALDVSIPFPINLENQAIRIFYHELIFGHEAGLLYNRLRNEMGLIYSLDFDFDLSLQLLTLSMTCEINSVVKIINEIKKVFSNFNEVFDEQKIEVIRKKAIKKQELIEDNSEAGVDFIANTLWDYGKVKYPQEFLDSIKNTKLEDLKKLYQDVEKGLSNMQVLVVSNNKEIEDIKPANL